MLIDAILDRAEGGEYSPKKFYDYISNWNSEYDRVASALDCGEEEDVRRELCRYIDNNEYNPAIKDYVNSVKWLEESAAADFSEDAKIFCNAIQDLANNPEALENLERYLAHHFQTWVLMFTRTPASLAGELKEFASIQL